MMKTSGFVLRKNDYREYDRIYTVYTEDFGKISLLARGAKKIQSKLAPSMENFGEVRINFAKGKIFNHLSGSRTLAVNTNILKDAEKIGLASDCLRLLDRFIKPEEADENIFSHLKSVLGAIADAPVSVIASPEQSGGRGNLMINSRDCFVAGAPRNDTRAKIKIYFFWKFVELLGYGPRLDECALCGAESGTMNNELWFNITDNILICKNCAGEGFLISGATLENLRKIFQLKLAEFLQTDLDSRLIAITDKARQIKLSEL